MIDLQDRPATGRPALIAVDLTPMLPGGENGGAKLLVLELLRELSVRFPQSGFLLLTHGLTHDELAALDAPNVRRLLVSGGTPAQRGRRDQLKRALRRIVRLLPRPAAVRAARLASGLARRRWRGPSLRSRGVDLLFCPFTAPVYREPGLPTVCTVYDLQARAYPQFFTVEDAAHREAAFTAACRDADLLVAISDFTRAGVVASSVAPGKVRTIYPCVVHGRDGARAAPEPDALRTLGVEPSSYLIYPANFWRHKNHDLLLSAFAVASREGLRPDLKLLLTGAPSPRADWLAHAAQALGIGGRVVLAGFVGDGTLAQLLAQARGLVFPSLYEGFGMPVVEAMDAGVPVACSEAAALPEVCAGAALMFDARRPLEIAAAIKRIDQDEALRRQLIELGRRRAAEFCDSAAHADRYWNAFQCAWAKKAGPRSADSAVRRTPSRLW